MHEGNVQELRVLNIIFEGNISFFLETVTYVYVELSKSHLYMNPKVNSIKLDAYIHTHTTSNVSEILNRFPIILLGQ